jgi:hypothetical protein
MEPKDGASCIVVRDSKILMIKQKRSGREYYAIREAGLKMEKHRNKPQYVNYGKNVMYPEK